MRRTSLPFIFIALLAASAFGQGWELQHPIPTCDDLSALSFADVNHGWAIGGGVVLHTSTGGRSWDNQDPGVSGIGGLYDVFALNSSTAWIVGGDGTILHTTDGGNVWQQQHLPEEWGPTLRSVFFLNDSIGWTGGSQSKIYATRDGGATWTLADSLSNYEYVRKLQFFDEQNGVAVGHSAILHTSDGGFTWSTADSNYLYNLDCGQFLDSNHGMIFRYPYGLSLTSDGGQTWTNRSLPDSNNYGIWDMSFLDMSNGWLVGYYGRIYHTTDGGLTWNHQGTLRTDGLNAVQFFDSNNGIAVGNYGVILVTNDGGANWTRRGCTRNLCAGIRDICFADNLHGWTIGLITSYLTGFLHTTDGGHSWQPQPAPYIEDPNHQLYTLCAANTMNAWAVGADIIVHTTDGGAEWLVQQQPDSHEFVQAAFTDALNGWVCGARWYGRPGFIWHTTDGGWSWSEQLSTDTSRVFALQMTDARHGWALNFSYRHGTTVYRTVNGEHWIPCEIPPGVAPQRLAFIDSLDGWISGEDSVTETTVLLHTTDNGDHWTTRCLSGHRHAADIAFSDRDHGWMTLSPDTILHTSDGGATWQDMSQGSPEWAYYLTTVPNGDAWISGRGGLYHHTGAASSTPRAGFTLQPSAFSLSSYPNPFNPLTSLEYTLPSSGRITLAVYDLTGRQVQTLVDQVMSAGAYRYTFDGSRLPSGIYFARLQGKGISKTQKLMLLK